MRYRSVTVNLPCFPDGSNEDRDEAILVWACLTECTKFRSHIRCDQLPVWFDNIAITHSNGRLQEEMHYYPHGLLIRKDVASGSSPENRFQYQGNESNPNSVWNFTISTPGNMTHRLVGSAVSTRWQMTDKNH